MSAARTAPGYLVAGHLVQDVVAGGFTPGGTALYATVAARRLGVETAVLTSAAPDADLSVLEGAHVCVIPAEQSTSMENRYGPGGRVQYLFSRATLLVPEHVPAEWLGTPIVHLGPIADEVDPTIATLFPRALRAATPQGWLRRTDSDKRVWHVRHEQVVRRLPELDVVVMSDEDVAGDEDAVDAYRERVRIVILTHGARGATVYTASTALEVPAFPAHEVDPTGAGDVFAAAFLIRYHQVADLLDSARFAAAAASYVVEGPGASTTPTLSQVEERLVSHQPSPTMG